MRIVAVTARRSAIAEALRTEERFDNKGRLAEAAILVECLARVPQSVHHPTRSRMHAHYCSLQRGSALSFARIFHAWNLQAPVESRKGARPGPTGSRLFPFPAHQTGRAQLEHPAFRQTSPTAHGRGPKWTSRSRNTPNSPNTTASEKWVVPREATLWRDRRKFRTRS